MKRDFAWTLVFASAFLAASPRAQETEDPLAKTQQLLLDPRLREQAIQGEEKAQKVDAYVKKITGGDAAKSQQVYSLSAGIMADLNAQAGGDPAKMQVILDRAAKDPEAFANSLSAEQKQKIRSLAGTLENPVPKP